MKTWGRSHSVANRGIGTSESSLSLSTVSFLQKRKTETCKLHKWLCAVPFNLFSSGAQQCSSRCEWKLEFASMRGEETEETEVRRVCCRACDRTDAVGDPSSSSSCVGWSIVAVAFVADAFSLGGRALFGVVMLFWNSEVSMSTAELSSLMALVHITQGIATPISGHAADRLPGYKVVGCGVAFLALCFGLTSLLASKWQVWLVYGVLCGSAYGLLNLNVFSVAVTRALPTKYEGLGVGIATSGSTFGQLVLTPLFAHTAQEWGWRYGYAFLGACTFLLLFPAIVLLKKSRFAQMRAKRHQQGFGQGADPIDVDGLDSQDSQEAAASPLPPIWHGGAGIETVSGDKPAETSTCDSSKAKPKAGRPASSKLCRLIRSWPYFALTVAFFICGITTTGFIETHLVSLAVHRSFSITTAAAAFSVLSGCNGVGMILAGWLTDRFSRTILLSLIFLGRALCYILLIVVDSNDVVALFVFSVLFGFCDYSVVPPVVSLVGTHAGSDSVGLGVGILLAWHSLGGALGSILGGTLFNPVSGYSGALWCCSILCFVAAVACLTICPEPVFRRRSDVSATSDKDRELAPQELRRGRPGDYGEISFVAEERNVVVF